MLRTAPSLPHEGFRRWAPTPPVSRRSRQPATGPPGSYQDRTSTGKRRRAYEHEETPWPYVTVSPPALLGARKPEARVNKTTAMRKQQEPWNPAHPAQQPRCQARPDTEIARRYLSQQTKITKC